MKKNKNRKVNNDDRDFSGYDKKPYPQKDRRPRQDVSREAKVLRDLIIDQIQDFEDDLEAGAPLEDAAKQLFHFDGQYPATVYALEDYDLYQLERNVSVSKQNPNILYSPSTIIVVMNRFTHKPAFLVKAFMVWSTQDKAYKSRIVIYEQGERGTIYGKTLRWMTGDRT